MQQMEPAADIPDASTCHVDVCQTPTGWEGYLTARGAGIFHDPGWGKLLAQAYGAQPLYLTARRDGRVVGVLPLVQQSSLLFGRRLCSMPYFDAAGILADDAPAAESLRDSARDTCAARRCRSVELRQLEPLAGIEAIRTDKITMWLPLPGDSAALWAELSRNARNQIRKAEKAGLSVSSGGAELLGAFHEVYVRNMRDLGSPPHSRRFFDLLIETFGPAVRVYVASGADGVHAAAIGIVDADGFHLPWAANDRRMGDQGGNRLMYWAMLRDAADEGCPRFDFGRCTRGSGTHQFKRQWRAQEVPLYWHYLAPGGSAAGPVDPDGAKYRLFVTCWKRLPVGLARRLGPGLIGKLS